MTDTLDLTEGTSSRSADRPVGCLSYVEAVEATGVSRRHLRRLAAAGKLEVMDQGGRRWVTTASLLGAGLSLNAPKPQASGAGPGGAETPGPAGGSSLATEVESLRRQVAVLQALVDERGRELDWFRDHATQLAAALPPGPQGDQTPGHAGGTVPGTKQRWWRKAR